MMSGPFLYADIAVPSVAATGDGVFTYGIPEALANELSIGRLVRTPLRRKLEAGIVVRLHDETPAFDVRPVDSIIEPPYLVPAWAMEVAEWMAGTTRCTFYDAISPFLPPGEVHAAEPWLRLVEGGEIETADLTALQRELVGLLQTRGPMSDRKSVV